MNIAYWERGMRLRREKSGADTMKNEDADKIEGAEEKECSIVNIQSSNGNAVTKKIIIK